MIRKLSSDIWLALAACVVLLAVCQTHPFGNYSLVGVLLLFPAMVFCISGIITSKEQSLVPHEYGTGLLFALAATALLYHCFASISALANQPGSDIDVYLFQHHSARALLRGVNPYTLTTENIYGSDTALYGKNILVDNRVQIGLPYPPASLFFVLPAYLLGDIRYAYVVAVLLTAIILLKLRTNSSTVGIVCLFLLSPVTRYVELQSWTEPFALLALTCTVYGALKKCWWLPAALGLFLASKQYSILALPFIPFLLGKRSWKGSHKLVLGSLSIAVALTLPLALWSIHGFWRDVIVFQFRQPFRRDALSLGNLLFPIPLYAILVFVTIGLAFATRRARPHPSMFAACFGFILLIFVCANKQAFCNYYFLIVYTLLLSAATLGIPFAQGEPSPIGWQTVAAGHLNRRTKLLPIT